MNILDNKPKPDLQYNLAITVETGIYKDNEWTATSVLGSQDWLFSVMYDNTVLMNCIGLSDKHQCQHQLQDTQETQDHLLIVVFRGNNPEKFESVKLTIEIEGVDVSEFVQRCEEAYNFDQDPRPNRYPGQIYMMFSGDQRFTISTPIYRWLYDRRDQFMNKYWQLYRKLVNDH